MQEPEMDNVTVSRMVPDVTFTPAPFRYHSWETPIERIASGSTIPAKTTGGLEIPQWVFRAARLIFGTRLYNMLRRLAGRQER